MRLFDGTYGKTENIRVHFDPLQSFIVDGKPIGFRIHIVPTRGERPREQSSIKKQNQNYKLNQKEESLLNKITYGLQPSVPIAGDDSIIGSPLDSPQNHNLTEFNGLAIVNKFSPLAINLDRAGGTALVIFPTQQTENLEHSNLNFYLLKAMKTAVYALLQENLYRENLYTPVTFFNIGPTSGASLRQLHAQTYCMTKSNGLLIYSFNKSFQDTFKCLICNMNSNEVVEDHLGQTIYVKEMTIWEDKNVRIVSPYAPIRPFSLRILPKNHLNYIGIFDDDSLKSIGKALSLGHKIISGLIPEGWSFKFDRTIAFRQTQDIREDFHSFIDLMPSIPLGGSEVIDSLSISSIDPMRIVKKMKMILEDL